MIKSADIRREVDLPALILVNLLVLHHLPIVNQTAIPVKLRQLSAVPGLIKNQLVHQPAHSIVGSHIFLRVGVVCGRGEDHIDR